MKKFLFNIYIIFGITSLAFAQDTYNVEYVSGFDMADYHSSSNCIPTRGTAEKYDEYLIIDGTGIYYKVVAGGNCHTAWVCVRGAATVGGADSYSVSHCFYGDNGNDEWDDEAAAHKPVRIANCSAISGFEKFTKGDLSVFVTTDQKVLMGKYQGQTFSPKTLVNKKNSIKCVGFVCKNGTYACNNGTCVANPTDICPENIPPAKTINGLPKIPTPPNPPASHESKAKEWKSKLK